MAKGNLTSTRYPSASWREIVPRLVEVFLLRTVIIETADSEVNIPLQGTLIAIFVPHSGWIENIVIDECFRMIGRPRPYWLTKAENRTLPRILSGDRLICVDLQNPEPSLIKFIYRLLTQPDIVLASSIEGTRSGNPTDPEDITTLGKFKTGMVRFAIRAQVPILPVVVLGAENIAPNLEQVWVNQGVLSAYREISWLITHPQTMQVRFLPLYTDHILAVNDLTKSRLRENIAYHTNHLRKAFVAQITGLAPDYPLFSC